jgi:hypothetical protein
MRAFECFQIKADIISFPQVTSKDYYLPPLISLELEEVDTLGDGAVREEIERLLKPYLIKYIIFDIPVKKFEIKRLTFEYVEISPHTCDSNCSH